MKKLLILSVLALTSCAPLVQLAQPKEKATLTRDGQRLLLTNPGPDALTGDPSRPGDGPALVADGTNLWPDTQASAWCKTDGRHTRLMCNLPVVPPGQRLRITFTGTVNDAGTMAYRPSQGARPIVIWLK